MEIYVESARAQAVHLHSLGLRVEFAQGERIHNENSYKYSMGMVESLLCAAGFKLKQSWFDKREWFGLHLAHV
jgi:uncharacterized SAM-dependent methyltransferase